LDRPIIFLNSAFPCLSETFIYDQFEALGRAGLRMILVSNRRPAGREVHPRMRPIQDEVVYLSDASIGEILAAHLHALRRHPRRYLACLARLFRAQERLHTSLAHLSGAALVLKRFDRPPRPRLHAHFTYGAAAVAMWAARLSGLKYSLTVHGSELFYDNPPDLEAKLTEADALVSISRFNVQFLQQHFPVLRARRITVLPLGIPPLPDVAAIPRSPGGPVRILNVGRLSEHKAQHHLIDACAILAEKGVAFRCDIVGEGPLRPLLEERIRRHRLGDQVRLLGARYHHEVLSLYGQADIFVLCSIAEGMPVVLMEAMRAGVPVIATAVSAIPELIGEGGLIVAPGDPVALADAVARLVTGQVDLVSMTAKARRIIESDYDLETNTQRFKDFLDRLD
jgi:glycosyltransferase involved in cell wall biosynthesis